MAIQVILIVAVLTGAAAAHLQVNEDRRSIPFTRKHYGTSRIVGGKPTTIEKFPWQLFVKTKKFDGIYNCGGSIISKDWSMSAAHCFAAQRTDGSDGGGGEGFVVTALRIYLFAGTTDAGPFYPDIQRNIFEVDDFENHVFIHPEYYIGANHNNDITILKNKIPWKFNDKVAPISLANADDFIVGKELIASGWGKTCTKCHNSRLLQYVTGLKLISREECTERKGDRNGWRVTDSMICDLTHNSNTCGGDSGGPVITGRGDSNGPPYVQIGIISWGSTDCDIYSPSMSTDVAKFRNWIDKTMAGSDFIHCKDMSEFCGDWADNGSCDHELVFWWCKSSCSCGIGSNPKCEDTESKCIKWAAEGKCFEKKVYNKCKSACACVQK